jgi:hypothetical protein
MEGLVELEVGREYALTTFYNFKTGAHEVKYLGDFKFRELDWRFFKGRETIDKRRLYFAIGEIEFCGIRNSLDVVHPTYSRSPDIDMDKDEFVFEMDDSGKVLGDRTYQEISDLESSELEVILKKLGGVEN